MLEDDIAYFTAVALAGSLARAALTLGVSQPALTKAVQRLEKRIGVPLLLRSTRGMTLTDAGQAFLARSRALARDLDDAVQEARDLGGGNVGILRIGATPAAADFTLRTLLPGLLRERPAARLQCVSGFSDVLLGLAASGELELALLPLPDRIDDNLDSLHLIDDTYSVIVNDSHRLAGKARIVIADLAGCQWAGSGKHEFARVQMERAFALHGFALPGVVVEANNLQTLLLAVSRLPLVSVVNTHSVAPESLPPNVVMRTLDSEHVRCPIGMVWRRGYLSSLAQRARQLLEAASRERAGDFGTPHPRQT